MTAKPARRRKLTVAKVRIGVIGTGTIANVHATGLKGYPGGEAVGEFLACASARNRVSAAQRKAREMMEQGELGDVYHVRWSRWRFRGRPGHHIFPESKWFLEMGRAGGGAMMDIAVYQIDSVLWLLGNPRVTSVMASMRQISEEPPPAGVSQDVEDLGVIMNGCEGGKSGIVE